MVGQRTDPVIIVSNDVVPGLGVPVAAPGLRAYGLAEGLRSHGFDVTTLVSKPPLEDQWKALGNEVPPPTPEDVEVIAPRQLKRYLETHAPATVILINSNQVDHLERMDGITYVLDFFAPKVLETLYHERDEYPQRALQRLRERKIRAIEMADAFIVNGQKKLPYFLGWLLQGERDIRRLPLEVVNMCVPLGWSETGPGSSQGPDGGVRFAVGGYLQSWSQPGSWLQVLEGYLEQPGIGLDILLPEHWGKGSQPKEENEHLEWLRENPSVRTYTPMVFSKFRGFLSNADVALDLFDYNLEREYAMITRSIVALAMGVPVVHPPFTEVSSMISGHDAGWLVDPADTATLKDLLQSIIDEPELVREKSENARQLSAELIDPRVATRPLAKIIKAL